MILKTKHLRKTDTPMRVFFKPGYKPPPRTGDLDPHKAYLGARVAGRFTQKRTGVIIECAIPGRKYEASRDRPALRYSRGHTVFQRKPVVTDHEKLITSEMQRKAPVFAPRDPHWTWHEGDSTIIDPIYASGWIYKGKRPVGSRRPRINPMKPGAKERIAELLKNGRPRPELPELDNWSKGRRGVIGHHGGVPDILRKETWGHLEREARAKYSGMQHQLKALHLFSWRDLLQEFLASNLNKIKGKDGPLIKDDFRKWVYNQYRDSDRKKREVLRAHTFTDHAPGEDDENRYSSVNPEGDTFDDRLDRRLNREGGYRMSRKKGRALYAGSYRKVRLTDSEGFGIWFPQLPHSDKIGVFVRMLLQMSTLSQRRIAERFNLSQSSISKAITHINQFIKEGIAAFRKQHNPKGILNLDTLAKDLTIAMTERDLYANEYIDDRWPRPEHGPDNPVEGYKFTHTPLGEQTES